MHKDPVIGELMKELQETLHRASTDVAMTPREAMRVARSLRVLTETLMRMLNRALLRNSRLVPVPPSTKPTTKKTAKLEN